MSLSDVTSLLLSWLLNPYALGALSAALVVVGSAMVLRDVLRNRRKLSTHFTGPVVAPPATPGEMQPGSQAVSPHAAATAVPPPPLVTSVPSPPGQPLHHLAAVIAEVRAELAAGDVDEAVARDPSMEASWHALQARLDRAVSDVQPVLASVRLSLSQAGEARWGLANRAFGAYRRVSFSGTSVGWLRSEITNDGVLRFRLRAHQPSMALLNSEGAVDLGRLSGPELARALTAALLPVTRYAAWNAFKSPASTEPNQLNPELIEEAVEIANGALVEARAALRRQEKPDAAAQKEVLLDVFVDGRQVALMRLNETEGGLDVSVGVPDPKRLDLTRRQTLASDHLAAYDLAETMATCAWPALAHALATTGAVAANRTGAKA